MTDVLLDVENVTKHFPITEGIVFRHEVASVKALDGVSLQVRRGETLGIVGESGCGKSTLARVIMRLLEPTGGTVRFDGRDITHLTEQELRPVRRELQMIYVNSAPSLPLFASPLWGVFNASQFTGFPSRFSPYAGSSPGLHSDNLQVFVAVKPR